MTSQIIDRLSEVCESLSELVRTVQQHGPKDLHPDIGICLVQSDRALKRLALTLYDRQREKTGPLPLIADRSA